MKVERRWHLIDVKDQVLGRVSTKIALLLSGKDKVVEIEGIKYKLVEL